MVVAWCIYPHFQWPRIDPVSAEGLVEIFNQVAIGAIAGLVLQVVVAAVVVGGQTIASAMGLSMANMLDPNLGNVPVVSQMLLLLASLVFVGTGSHALLIGLMIESFKSLPVGTSVLEVSTYVMLVRWTSMMFLGAVLMALPIMVTLLFINIGLGVVTRAAPSLNIFAVGFPAMIVAGFLILIMSMDSLVGRIEWLWLQAFEVLRQWLGVSSG